MSEQFNGTVRVKDGNKAPMDYGVNREVEVSMSFFTDTEAKLKSIAVLAANVADEIVNEKLGRTVSTAASADKPASGRTSRKQPPAPATEPKVESAPTVTIVAPTTPTPSLVPDLSPPSGQNISTGEERLDPGSVPPVDVFSSASPSKPEINDNNLIFSSASPSKPEINDNHLMAAITRVNGKYKGEKAPTIRGLIAEYVPQDGKPHQAAEIEQGKRQEFLTKLEEV